MNTLKINSQNPEKEWVDYIMVKANDLMLKTEKDIEESINVEILRPDVIEFLEADSTEKFIEKESDPEGDFYFNSNAKMASNSLSERYRFRFRKVKNKIQSVFCSVISELKDLDPQTILKGVLLLIIPAFASGLPAVILPIIIGLLAIFLKKGVSVLCPV